jgi:Ni,Fe-hydrogenase III small subunit/NAD-dependent dihydropyrimidine dehydrogenase PreA subunit
MLKVLKNRFEQGCRTSAYPREPIALYSRYRGLPVINPDCPGSVARHCAEICPQEAIDPEKRLIDLGRCTFCGECETVDDGAFVRFSQDFELGAANRQDLLTAGHLPDLAAHAKTHFKKLFGRSLQLRQVSAAGCNACEADTNVLTTPFFDLSRFGIDFVASPRHADLLLVTGPVSRHMQAALKRTYDAMPAPRLVVAMGDCGADGGEFGVSYASCGAVANVIPVDAVIRGCPPSPLQLLVGILEVLQRS